MMWTQVHMDRRLTDGVCWYEQEEGLYVLSVGVNSLNVGHNVYLLMLFLELNAWFCPNNQMMIEAESSHEKFYELCLEQRDIRCEHNLSYSTWKRKKRCQSNQFKELMWFNETVCKEQAESNGSLNKCYLLMLLKCLLKMWVCTVYLLFVKRT